MVSDVEQRAREWLSGDPDPATRAELEHLIETGDRAALESRMSGKLEFGTAGIRAEVAAGPNRMNRAVVIRTTRGLVDYLIGEHGGVPERSVVIGYDARPSSRQFAEDAAGVIMGAGIPVRYFPEVAPTPLVAFACKHFDAAAAVVVTASHNPPADNGYKVYAANGAQIIPPMDEKIAAAIDSVGPANQVPRVEGAFDSSNDLLSPISGNVFDAYWSQVNQNRPSPTTSDLKVVYTPIHGVGGVALAEVFQRAGHRGLIQVPEQADPDGSFPTVAFPNPEEEGALDLAIQMAEEKHADLVIANDPDADRFAAVVPQKGSWRSLTGNEIGVLLGDYILRNTSSEQPIVISSIVSSPMLGRLAGHYGAHFERTLTGFKWIANAAMALEAEGVGEFVFGYEEALGYTIGPTVRDKDGISTALVFVDLVTELRRSDETVMDRLAELWSLSGIWASAQHSITRRGESGQAEIVGAVEWLADSPPRKIGDVTVSEVVDYRSGGAQRPAWLGEQDLVELILGDEGRVLVRPSGTEPKLKIYVDLSAPAGDDVVEEQSALERRCQSMASQIEELLPI